MAIALVLDFIGDPDMQKKYDAVNESMGVHANPPDGLIFHWSALLDGGNLRVVDVWESQAHFDRFREMTLGPAFARVQAPQPKITTYQVYGTIPRVPAHA